MRFIVWLFGRVREIETATQKARTHRHTHTHTDRESATFSICSNIHWHKSTCTHVKRLLQMFYHFQHTYIFSRYIKYIVYHPHKKIRTHEMNQFSVYIKLIKYIIIILCSRWKVSIKLYFDTNWLNIQIMLDISYVQV